MKKELLILAIIVSAVLADNYRCPRFGETFECYESAPTSRFCLTDKSVICSKCRRKFEFCRNGLSVSKYPERDCGRGWESTECTEENADVPDTL